MDIKEREIEIRLRELRLAGTLSLPAQAKGIVIFAHGSGSSRHSPRNRYVAGALQERGFATLLMDLLDRREEGDRRKVFDIGLLAERLAAATSWVRSEPETRALRQGYFGASTGAAVALVEAARPGLDVAAVVSRGGRPDLAEPALREVKAPTLLIVGALDTEVLVFNRRASALLRCEKRLVEVPDATHLFEEPGTLEQVARLAAGWFERWIPAAAQHADSRREVT